MERVQLIPDLQDFAARMFARCNQILDEAMAACELAGAVLERSFNSFVGVAVYTDLTYLPTYPTLPYLPTKTFLPTYLHTRTYTLTVDFNVDEFCRVSSVSVLQNSPHESR